MWLGALIDIDATALTCQIFQNEEILQNNPVCQRPGRAPIGVGLGEGGLGRK